jgi:endopeptidase La
MSAEAMKWYPTTKIPLIPVHAISLPVPGQADSIAIPKEFLPCFDSKSFQENSWILVCAPKKRSVSIWQTYNEAIDYIDENPWMDPSDPFMNIGILCKLLSSDLEGSYSDEFDSNIYVEVLPVRRASIADVKVAPNGANSKFCAIYTDILLLDERFLPSEEEFAEECSYALDLFLKKIMGLDTSEQVDRILKASSVDYGTGNNKEESLLGKMDMLAEFLVLSERDKVTYLQSTDNIERLNIVVSCAREYLLEYQRWRNTEYKEFKSSKELNTQSAFQIEKYLKPILDEIEADYPSKPPKSEDLKVTWKRTSSTATKKKTKLTLGQQVMSLDLDPEAKSQLEREVAKLEKLNPTSLEHSVLTDYLEWVCEIPWGTYSYVSDFDISELKSSLSETHYGLDNVKDHVVEHLAIEKLRGSSKGSVLCFVGPPGTGKTSIAKQIANVTNRKLVKIALGGMSDESEIRGHRRTYVASRPGRFALGLKNSGAMDPLFLLDECDKINSSHRGDPTAALLEVLDPEQNDSFIDRYLEIPVDLSKASFICTANYLDQIPPALRDRMEFIHFREYTKEERIEITKNHLIERCVSEYNLSDYDVNFSDEVIEKICETTQVRQIERDIKKMLRMSAVLILTEQKQSIDIDLDFFEKSKCNDNNKDKKSKKIGFGF